MDEKVKMKHRMGERSEWRNKSNIKRIKTIGT